MLTVFETYFALQLPIYQIKYIRFHTSVIDKQSDTPRLASSIR